MEAIRQTFSRKERGFTLIELLVVIAIIAVLAALVLAALSSAQKGSRDSRRQSDLNQYRTSLANYYGDTGAYPTQAAAGAITTQPCTALVANYISSCINDTTYAYTYISAAGTNFGMCARLERDNTQMFRVGPTVAGKLANATCTEAG